MNATDARAALADYGLILPDELPTRQLCKCRTVEDAGRSDSGWFWIAGYLSTQLGQSVVGAYGNLKRGNEVKTLALRWANVHENQRETARADQAQGKAAGEHYSAEQAGVAITRSEKALAGLYQEGDDSWFRGQGVTAPGAFYGNGRVAIPLRSIRGRLRGLEFYDQQGGRKLVTGTRTRGAAFVIGEPEPDHPVLLSANLVSALALYKALGWQSAYVVADDNLPNIVGAWRKRFPAQDIGVCLEESGDARSTENRWANKCAQAGAFIVSPPTQGPTRPTAL